MSAYRVGFIVMLTLVSIAFVAVLWPFFSAILWAVVFAIIFFPLHARIERAVKGHENLAAGLSVLACLCLVIVPGLVVAISLANQANALFLRIQDGEFDLTDLLRRIENTLPLFIREYLEGVSIEGLDHLRESVSAAAIGSGGFFAGRALSLGQSTLAFLLSFGTMLYLLFFLFRDGRKLAQTIRRAVPLSDDHTRKFAQKFTSVVRATVRGNVIIAIIQGLIGGIAFWFVDLQPAFLWGVAMIILSMLPAVGAMCPSSNDLRLFGLWKNGVSGSVCGLI
ncbi:hypothetical protein ACO34A_28465 (plasmid) [Rhizobium sp. ACO-34A]|nr:AI-2E family transporter [Rhizobium sp. ACO-34A]ATN37704.1 hypothetical protein ACO34A_28465 [Rhizobium sp. ACO-34A]